VSSDDIDKFEETEEEMKNEKEHPYNLENESKKTLKASWKNEMETDVDKTIPRITSRHFKKIRSRRERLRRPKSCFWHCACLMRQII
jgi:hypothetical protein